LQLKIGSNTKCSIGRACSIALHKPFFLCFGQLNNRRGNATPLFKKHSRKYWLRPKKQRILCEPKVAYSIASVGRKATFGDGFYFGLVIETLSFLEQKDISGKHDLKGKPRIIVFYPPSTHYCSNKLCEKYKVDYTQMLDYKAFQQIIIQIL